MAEWQTRQTQNLLSERTWEFKSPRPHQWAQCLRADHALRKFGRSADFEYLSVGCRSDACEAGPAASALGVPPTCSSHGSHVNKVGSGPSFPVQFALESVDCLADHFAGSIAAPSAVPAR